jgi:hypothetical protein
MNIEDMSPEELSHHGIHVALVDELDSFDPDWRTKYKGVLHASQAAGVTSLFWQWADTPNGERYFKAREGVKQWHDIVKSNKAQIAAERGMSAAHLRDRN